MTASSGAPTVRSKTDLERLLDKKGFVQLLDVFLANEEIPVTRSGLEEFSGLSQPTVYRRVKDLCEMGIVEKSETDSPRMFRLNTDHEAASGLLEAHTALHAHTETIKEASEEYDGDDGQFHTGSPFVELFRYPTNVSILVALLQHPDNRLKAAELARIAGVDRATVGENIQILVDIDIATKNHPSYAANPTYTLNSDHTAVPGFKAVSDSITQQVQPNPTEPEAPDEEDLQASDDKKRQQVHEHLADAVKDESTSPAEDAPEGVSKSDIWGYLKLELSLREEMLSSSGEEGSTEEEDEDTDDGLKSEYKRYHASQSTPAPGPVGAAA